MMMSRTVLRAATPLVAATLFFALPRAADTSTPHEAGTAAKWVEVVEHKLDDARVRRPEGQGAMGASVVSFQIGAYQGSILVEMLERGAVAAFVGWNIEAKNAKRAAKDLRVVWHEVDGKEHETEIAAGGGNALLFHSPDGLPPAKLARFVLVRRDGAKWASSKRRRR